MPKRLTKSKAKTILEENQARGKPLTTRQKKFFAFIASGGKSSRN